MKQMLLAILLLSCVIVLIISVEDRTVVYNCEMIELHPDVPKEVKEECQKIKMQLVPRNYNTI